jgi:uncharacterized protein YegP (UPF0339 family)
MAGIFELKQTANGQFMFNLKVGNGEIILTSETYKGRHESETFTASYTPLFPVGPPSGVSH